MPLTNCIKVKGRTRKISQEIHQARMQLVSLPEVREVLHKKWGRFGAKRYNTKFLKSPPLPLLQLLWPRPSVPSVRPCSTVMRV